jgi:hypothetical protein
MIGFKIDKAKGMFFDSPKIVRAVDNATRRVLSKFGAFVRRGAKSSIRKRKKASATGNPPSSHTGLLKKFIYFGYDQAARSVVIGPARLNQVSFSADMTPVTGTIPSNLEYGGSAYILEERGPNGTWHRKDLRRRGSVASVGDMRYQVATGKIIRRDIRRRKITVKPRPFMHPALNKELPKLPAMWRDSVKK